MDKIRFVGTISTMNTRLEKLLDRARKVIPNKQHREEQRRGFAYGNTHIENVRISRATIDKAADELNKGVVKKD